MQLPFSREAFFDLFAAYNNAWWPVALVLWLATCVAFVARVGDRGRSERTFGLLAVQWAWSGVVYHAGMFSRINPAAWLFAALFLIQTALMIWYGVAQHRLQFSNAHSVSRLVGYALVVYGLLYPLIAVVGGHSYPLIPTFGLPCPTTIVTIGFLMLVREPIPPMLTVVPLLWAIIGGSAACLLGVRADLALLVAGFVMARQMWSKRAIVAA